MDEAFECLQAFIAETVDYMTRNHLGDPEKQHNVKWARAILARAALRKVSADTAAPPAAR